MLMASEDTNTPYLILTSPEQRIRKSSSNAVYMLPSENMMHKAILDIVKFYDWDSIAVLYDNPKGMKWFVMV